MTETTPPWVCKQHASRLESIKADPIAAAKEALRNPDRFGDHEDDLLVRSLVAEVESLRGCLRSAANHFENPHPEDFLLLARQYRAVAEGRDPATVS